MGLGLHRLGPGRFIEPQPVPSGMAGVAQPVISFPALSNDFPVDAWRSAKLAGLAWVVAAALDLALAALLAGLGDAPIGRGGRLVVSHEPGNYLDRPCEVIRIYVRGNWKRSSWRLVVGRNCGRNLGWKSRGLPSSFIISYKVTKEQI